ncbi:cohesin domain-containing protein [candidate division KSB1 bacterium]
MKFAVVIISTAFFFFFYSVGTVYSQVDVSLPDTTLNLNTGDEFSIPVYASSLDGLQVQSFQFVIGFDTNFFSYSGIEKSVISSPFTVLGNEIDPGILIIAAYGTSFLQGSGNLFYLKFNILKYGKSSLQIIPEYTGSDLITRRSQFNEGNPSSVLDNGLITRIDKNNVTIPENYTLRNYPNPFNNTTVIEYSIKKSGIYKLEIFDITGRSAGVLKKEHFYPGFYRFRFNAGNLSSGIYVILLSGERIKTAHRILLIK